MPLQEIHKTIIQCFRIKLHNYFIKKCYESFGPQLKSIFDRYINVFDLMKRIKLDSQIIILWLDNTGPYYYDGYMAHLHKKIKKGRTYYYVRESTSVAGKTKIINQVYLGSAERIMQLALSTEQKGILKVKSQMFGALWLSNLVEKDVDVVSMIDGIVGRATKEKGPTIGQYFLYAVMNRMVQPSSKSALPEWYAHSAIQSIRPVDISGLDSRHFWKKMGSCR